jgi:hypothetical protein
MSRLAFCNAIRGLLGADRPGNICANDLQCRPLSSFDVRYNLGSSCFQECAVLAGAELGSCRESCGTLCLLTLGNTLALAGEGPHV